MLEIKDKVIDQNGYTGVITNIFPNTGQIQVLQKPKVTCTYDSEKQLSRL